MSNLGLITMKWSEVIATINRFKRVGGIFEGMSQSYLTISLHESHEKSDEALREFINLANDNGWQYKINLRDRTMVMLNKKIKFTSIDKLHALRGYDYNSSLVCRVGGL